MLTEDDLGVLVDALVEGRGMWSGVRDALTILVGGNVGEVIFTIVGTAFGAGRAPIGTRQLLLVNLLTDMFPALAVAVTPVFPNLKTATNKPVTASMRHTAPTSVRCSPSRRRRWTRR
ncbi:putative cation transporting ATPase [Mycobacterium xenopi 4042]|uniref:Putative cation transporting ATPase n=1 Tax=Mycobacterium xenopi 4042 TaxID=1299334 RepID=X8CKY9_MYCXE|nr:putative cation transporting ATPase [Mycobacterium xenopi 4042]